MEENIKSKAWSIQTKLVVIVSLLVLLGYAAYRFREITGPLVLAVIFAYVLSPGVRWLEKKIKIPRFLAILIFYLVLFFLIGLGFYIAIPMLINQISSLDLGLHDSLAQASAWFGQKYEFAGFEINGNELLTRAVDAMQGFFEPVIGQTLDIVTVLFTSLIWLIFILIISFYLIKDSEKVLSWFEHLVPVGRRRDYNHILNEINQIWSAFFRGQLILALLVMLIISSVGLIIGLRFALVLGILAGFLEFFPSVGHMVWLVVASLVSLLGGSTWIEIPNWAFLILVFCIYIVYTQFDLNYLIPKIIGRSVKLPPMVVILGIVIGAATAGVLGIVLAAPTIASLRVLGRYIYAHLVEIEPFMEPPASEPLPEPDLRWWHGKLKRFRRLSNHKE
jgi:predicted PurR-regulated permease PerM